jgi:hypothetical protein
MGAAKTGTHSLADIFGDAVPAAHEPEARRAISHILLKRATLNGRMLRNYLAERDGRLGLTIDASQLNIFMARDLVALFPDSRFVMTVRHPADWLRSMIDDSLRRDIDPFWQAFRLLRFGWPKGHPPEEAALARRGLHRLAGYLGYWRFAIEEIERTVPPDRLLVVDLRELSARQAEIARFCGLDVGAARAEPVVRFANPARFGVLEEIAPDYLARIIERECGALLSRYFPDLDARRSLEISRGASA